MRRRLLWLIPAALLVVTLLVVFWPRRDDGYDFLRDLHPREYWMRVPGQPMTHNFAFHDSPTRVAAFLRSRGVDVQETRKRIAESEFVITQFTLPDGREADFCQGDFGSEPAPMLGPQMCEVSIQEDQPWLDRQIDAVKSFFHLK
jgi:hypothetical protein